MSLTVDYGYNFKYEGSMKIEPEDIAANGWLYDSRTNFVCTGIDLSNLDWYANYLEYNYILAVKTYSTGKRRIAYYLDIGYMPVVFLPSFLRETKIGNINAKWVQAMDMTHIPCIKMPGSSFVPTNNMFQDMVDVWVSKMDAAKILGCKPEDVRSIDFVREVLING